MGRNGVGKTTFLRNVVGLEKSSAGNVLMDGTDITQMEAYERAARGIGYVPQGRQIFPLLSVEENLSVGLEAANSGERIIPENIFTTFPVLGPNEKTKRRRFIGRTATTIRRLPEH
jgi:urea transport system ATP-binding protein